MLIFALMFFVLGSVIGSFLNVVIYRWPREESVVTPRSKCPSCSVPIPAHFNVPIFSWVFLKGLSACCKTKISVRYPLVEFLTGTLFVLTYALFGLSFQTLEYCIFVAMAVPCVFIDLEHYLLPDVLTIPGMILGLAGSFLSDTRTFIGSLMGLLIGGGVFWFISWFYEKYRHKEGMGFGDVKLIAWLGALGGISSVLFVTLVSSLLGTAVGLFLISFKGGDRNTALPFGPFLLFAAFLYFYFGDLLKDLFPGFFLFVL